MFLSEETPLAVEDSNGAKALTTTANGGPVTWRTTHLSIIPRLALVVKVNSRVTLEPITIGAGDVGLIVFGPTLRDSISDESRVVVRFRPIEGASPSTASTELELYGEDMPGFNPREPWIERRFRLDQLVGTTGSFVLACAPASGVCPSEAEIGFYEFVISDEGSLELNRARAFKHLRMRNEKATFDAYYQHLIFEPKDQTPPVEANSDTAASETRSHPVRRKNPFWSPFKRLYRIIAGERTADESPAGEPRGDKQSTSQEAPTVDSTSAFSYSHNLLIKKMNLTPPPFGWRLQTKLQDFNCASKANEPSKFRVLSLCAGAARIETDIIRGLPAENLKLSLVDMNPNLLDTAKQRLSELCEVEGILSDVNELDLQGEKFDVIMCVSGLHHVVELEHLIEEVAKGLSDTGEFWSIGENAGRNGGRVWPESYEVASAFFDKLDEKYRVNRMIALTVDEYLPDMDYSIGCFEGIRCEAIEPTLLHYLSPIDVSRHNCIIWKLFSPTYSDNYDMHCPEDLALIEEAVDLDIDLFRRGGRPIELNGVYGRLR